VGRELAGPFNWGALARGHAVPPAKQVIGQPSLRV